MKNAVQSLTRETRRRVAMCSRRKSKGRCEMRNEGRAGQRRIKAVWIKVLR